MAFVKITTVIFENTLSKCELALRDACLERMHYLDTVPRMAHAKNRSPQLSRGDEFPNGFSWGLNIL